MINVIDYQNPQANEFIGAQFLQLLMDSPEINAVLEVNARKKASPEARFLEFLKNTEVVEQNRTPNSVA